MNIIGISGLEGSIPFKRALWPGLNEREYRISQGHDSAAVLVVDGIPVAAAAEERFTRQKHTGNFPAEAISFCLAEAGLKLDDIDQIAHAFDYAPYKLIYSLDATTSREYEQVYSREALLRLVARDLPGYPAERVNSVNHHLAHAASTYYTSGWSECLVVVVDGMGEAHGSTIYQAADGRLHRIAEISALDSIGILYSLVTLHLGFDFNSDEYKIMGLAPYGDPRKYRPAFEKMVNLCEDGTIRIPILHFNRAREQRDNYTGSRRQLDQCLIPARHPAEEVTQEHCDIAAALQECLDRVMLHICGHFGKATGARRIALAGGVALNCTANGRLVQSGLFDEVYVQPAAGDDGAALGAALHRAAEAGEACNMRFPVPYLGPVYSNDAIEQALTAFDGRIDVQRYSSMQATCEDAARLIAQGKVVAWYRGRMEFGPRALGHRSILANPGDPEMRDRINAMVKMREAFRPFAPAVTQEQVDRWFEVAPMTELPYMITTVDVREQYRAQLPAITHVNGSARVQTVSASDDLDFHTLLQAVGRHTGREMVLNTSFNIKGQPIVNTPIEAIYTFLGTGIEYLFLEDVMVARRTEPSRQDRKFLEDILEVAVL